jgi:hypothetical protein
MNWKLILLLSLFGLAMGLATVWFISSTVEPFFWLGIFLVSAYMIAKYAPAKFFLHGFMVSIVNSIWVTAAHATFFFTYVVTHPEYLAMTNNLAPALAAHPRRMLLAVGPISGILSGLVLGLFSWVASKFLKRNIN